MTDVKARRAEFGQEDAQVIQQDGAARRHVDPRKIFPQPLECRRDFSHRAAARRGERANVRISLSVTGRGDTTTQLPGTPPANGGGTASQLPGDALVAGTPFHARGILSCAVRLIGPLGDCNYGVIRQGSGSAAIVVSKLDGRSRTIVYRQGTPIGYDQARGEPARLTWTRQGDEITVRIGNERYVIPDAAVYGG